MIRIIQIYNGNIYDAIAVMQMIDTIYKSDNLFIRIGKFA